jgi:hypothetical protein
MQLRILGTLGAGAAAMGQWGVGLWACDLLLQLRVIGALQFEEIKMDLLVILIVLLLLFGGGGGLYWGLGAGWGLGPIGLIVVVLVVAYLLNGYRGRRGPRI